MSPVHPGRVLKLRLVVTVILVMQALTLICVATLVALSVTRGGLR